MRSPSIANQLHQVFPYHLGPTIRRFATPLLYGGKLCVSLPSWLHQEQIAQCYNDVFTRASATHHPILDTMRIANHHFALAQRQAEAEVSNLSPLGDRIQKIIILYPGTPEHYQRWEPVLGSALPLLAPELQHPQLMNVAAVEFIWRVYESYLVEDGNPARVLDSLNKRVTALPDADPNILLLECLLNRFSVAGTHHSESYSAIYNVTDRMAFLEVPTLWQINATDDIDLAPRRIQTLAFTLFDQVLAEHVPLLEGKSVQALANLMERRKGELDELRKTCWREATALVYDSPTEPQLRRAISDALERIQGEIQAVLEIDSTTLKKYLWSLAEDDYFWCLVGGIIGSATLGAPNLLSAAIAMTAFSKLGTKALKSTREASDVLRSSPWSFLYYLKRKT